MNASPQFFHRIPCFAEVAGEARVLEIIIIIIKKTEFVGEKKEVPIPCAPGIVAGALHGSRKSDVTIRDSRNDR